MLCSDWRTFTRLADEVALPAITKGRGLAVDRGSIEDLANRFAFALEIQLHVGGSIQQVRKIIADLSIDQVGPGWNRTELRRAGLLPHCWFS